MDARKALAEVWDAVNDLSSLAETFDPDDQLDDEEVAQGLHSRADRYDLDDAGKALDALIAAAEGVVETHQHETQFELDEAVDDLREALGLPRVLDDES